MARARNIYAYWAERLDLTRSGLPELLGNLGRGPLIMRRYMPERALIGQELHRVYQNAAGGSWGHLDPEESAASFTADYAARVIGLRARWSTDAAARAALLAQFPDAGPGARNLLHRMVSEDIRGYYWTCSPLALELRLGY